MTEAEMKALQDSFTAAIKTALEPISKELEAVKSKVEEVKPAPSVKSDVPDTDKIKELIAEGVKSAIEARDGEAAKAAEAKKEETVKAEEIQDMVKEAVNKALAAVLTQNEQVTRWVREAMEQAAGQPGGLVLVADIEALHPYQRIGTVEQSIQGNCRVPLVILYPGTRTGRTALRFLGVYPEDGNYRSIHIGG